jgi:hypothetical protein
VATSTARRAGLDKGCTTSATPSRIALATDAQCATIINGHAHRKHYEKWCSANQPIV